ncbi:hypothetical protein Tco_0268581 [Tanacetum coccineum]
MTITRSGMTSKVIEEMITRRVAEALAEQEANRNLGTIVESESENGDDNKNGNGGGRRNGNEGRRNGRNGNGNQGGNASRAVIASRSFALLDASDPVEQASSLPSNSLMWGTLKRLPKDRMSEGNLLSACFLFR